MSNARSTILGGIDVIMKKPAFTLDFFDKKNNIPPRPEYADGFDMLRDPWAYERGRLFATCQPKLTYLFTKRGNLSPKAERLYIQHVNEGDIL